MSDDRSTPGGIRLSKLLAEAGLASRRGADAMIAAGRVRVDGEIVTRLGTRIDPVAARVELDGKRVTVRDDVAYLALNKPRDVLSAMADDRGRRTVADFLKPWQDKGLRLFHVGRLDADTEGLLLVTGDGALAHKLAHPSFSVPKTYLAEVIGAVPRDLGRRLRAGIALEDGPVAVDGFRVVERTGGGTLVEVVLHEGRNRIVRRMLDATGHPVRRLVRTRFGPIHLGGQRAGSVRELDQGEIGSLYAAIDRAAIDRAAKARHRRGTDR
ncbi:MAG: pseudouridine synthase [Mycobacteriales bacterium]